MSAQHRLRRPLALVPAALALAACADRPTPLAPPQPAPPEALASAASGAEYNRTLAELRRVTARYHDVNVATHDGFVPVTTACEEEEGGETMPIPYASFDRLLDGALDPSRPDALLYEPEANGRLRLVGVEMAVPYPLWTAAEPPTFLGVPLQREDALGVYGLHVWVWYDNPAGMFAEANPHVTCAGQVAGL